MESKNIIKILGESDEPPSNKTDMDISTGVLPAYDTLARRFKGIRRLWVGDWSFCPVRGDVCIRRLSIFMDFQRK